MSLQQVKQLFDGGDIEGAWSVVKDDLTKDPKNPDLLLAAIFCLQKIGNWPMAYHMSKVALEYAPDRPELYISLGAAAGQLFLSEEAIQAAKRALKLSKTKEMIGISLMNHASVLINTGRYKEALPLCEEAIKNNPTKKTYGNLGMVQLALGDWNGWDNYSQCLGTNERHKQDYGLPDWNGEDGTVIIYGEQGLGDEISFASVVRDVTANIVIDCDYRLKGLFQRSFPNAYVHGGRWKEKYKGKADYQCAIGELSRIYRRKDSDFPRKAYLKADPLRASQWKYLKEQVKKPLVGIAWTGGMVHTASKHRQFTEEQLKQIMDGIDGHYVSLEYKERPPIDGIHVYPHATLTDDYDDTAALVSECDLVITIQTAVAHLAGALGVPCHVFVPETNQWRYAAPNFLWYTDNFHVHKAPWDLKGFIDAHNH